MNCYRHLSESTYVLIESIGVAPHYVEVFVVFPMKTRRYLLLIFGRPSDLVLLGVPMFLRSFQRKSARNNVNRNCYTKL